MPRSRLRRVPALVLLALSILSAFGASAALAETVSFSSTGAEQSFVVPAGITGLHVVAVGGKGGDSFFNTTARGGFGAVVTGDVPVTAGETIYVEVGGNGGNGTYGVAGVGGFNGGGGSTNGGGDYSGGGGGGASDIRTVSRTGADTLASRLLVAGGGGGAGGDESAHAGGAGGGAGSGGSAGTGAEPGGGGGPGTAGAGGFGGAPGGSGGGGVGAGGLGSGSDGGSGTFEGGGGGGGLFGGGGGGDANMTNSGGGGGGGGSSVGGTVALDTTGVPAVTITYTASSSGTGTAPSTGDGAAGAPAPTGGGAGKSSTPTLDTTIDVHPPKLLRTQRQTAKVRFRFSANAVRPNFLCKIDGNPFTGCQAPKVYDLSPGKHVFAVKAVKGGAVDTTPAEFTFKIERVRRHGRRAAKATKTATEAAPSRGVERARWAPSSGWWESP